MRFVPNVVLQSASIIAAAGRILHGQGLERTRSPDDGPDFSAVPGG